MVAVVCLADINAKKIPSVEERLFLWRQGWGAKKIQFDLDDEESDVMKILESDDLKNETIDFRGGFELMNCKQNCRELSLITCYCQWNVRSLKSSIGNQTKIYIRTIQTSLDTTTKDQGEVLVLSDAKVSCKTCHCLFSVRELRNHVNICVVRKCARVDEFQDLVSDDLPDPEINRQEQMPDINPTQSFIPLQLTDQEANLNDTILYINPPFVVIPNKDETQMATSCIVPSSYKDLSTSMMKGDESNLSYASKTICTGVLDGQSQNAIVSSRLIQALPASQLTATNSLEVTSATNCITFTEGTICVDAFLSPVSEKKED